MEIIDKCIVVLYDGVLCTFDERIVLVVAFLFMTEYNKC